MWELNEWNFRKCLKSIYHNYHYICFIIILFLFLAALVFTAVWDFSSCSEQRLLSVVVHGLFIVVASLVPALKCVGFSSCGTQFQ